jgi:hypothetical protein
MAREGFSVDAVRAMAGHKDHRTAQGYAHAKSRAGDAARLSDRFASDLFDRELALDGQVRTVGRGPRRRPTSAASLPAPGRKPWLSRRVTRSSTTEETLGAMRR